MSGAAKRWCSRQKIANGPMKSVLAVLAYMHREGGELFPSQRHLADEAGSSERAIREALALLEHFGVVTRTARSRGWYGRTSDRYRLTLDQDFTLTGVAISTARKALRGAVSNRHHVPVASPARTILQPARGANATGTTCQGIEGYKQEDAYQGKLPSEVRDAREGWPRLTVVAGGRP